MILIRHSKAIYVLTEAEIVQNLPSDVLAKALRRGKWYQRGRTRTEREAKAQEAAELRRDGMLA